MNKARLKLLSKLAGRIPVEKYQAQIFDIINKVQAFIDARKHHSLSGMAKANLGTIQFDINGRPAALEVQVMSDKNAYFEAGLEWPKAKGTNPAIVINLSSLSNMNPVGVLQTLRPLIVHEVTHFIEYQYDPVSHALPDEDETKSPFFKDFFAILNQSKDGINWNDVSKEPREIRNVAKVEAFKIFRSKGFKDLLTKYNLVLDKPLIGKILNVMYQSYLDDLVFYKTTGGDPFGIENSPEDKARNKKVREKAMDVYFNSNSEVLAYINQIIDEVQAALREEKGAVTLMNLIQGKASVSAKLDEMLAKSETYLHIKNKWSEENLRKLYHQLGTFLAKTYRKMTAQDKANKFGLKISPQQHLIYRYLLKLMDENPDRLDSLIRDEDFRTDNIEALRFLKNDLDFRASLERMEKALSDLKI